MHNLITRTLPAVAVAAGLLLAGPAEAKKPKPVKATIALGDKRPVRAHAAGACPNADVVPTPENVEVVRAALLCLHNQVRAENRLPALKDNPKLQKAALGHSYEMIGDGFFDHTSPNGATFVDRILSAGYVKRSAGWTLGENLAWGTGDLSTPAGIMQSWMASPGHKANILKRSYRELGIGVRIGVPSDASVGATVTADFGAKL